MTDTLNRFQVRADEGWRALSVSGDIHDVDDGRHEIAVDFPFDVVDGYKTDWKPGVWDESFRSGWKPPMVWNHNSDLLIGATRGSERLSHAQRMVGRFSDFDSVPLARQAFAQARDGDIPGYSFHYRNAKAVPHRSIRGARSYVQAHMAEWGPTTMPSIPGAVAVGVRSQETNMTVTLDALLALRALGEIDEEGFRALVGENFPDVADRLLDGRRAVSQALPHGNGNVHGNAEYKMPGRVGYGPKQSADQHAAELASQAPGAPSIEEILTLRDKGHLDDDGVHSLIRDNYPHLADRWRRPPPSSETEVRALLTSAYGEEATRHIQIMVPRAGSHIIAGSADDPDDDGDNDAAAELIQAINAALEASSDLVDEGSDTRSATDVVPEVRAYIQAAQSAAIELADVLHVPVGLRASEDIDEGEWNGESADYSPQQYRSATLIDTGEGGEDSKSRYKLPVRTPEGKLSRRGVHAAAAALVGARGGVQASSDQKKAAARKLLGHYNTLGDKPPPSLLKVAGKVDDDGDDDGGRSVPIDPEEIERTLNRASARVAKL